MVKDDPGQNTARVGRERSIVQFIEQVCAVALFLFATAVNAASPGAGQLPASSKPLMIQAGPYVIHRDYSPEHNPWPLLVGAEWGDPNRVALGGAAFRNSFYQPCFYLYAAKRWFLPSVHDNVYLKLSGGPLYGYRGKYEKKVPFNHNGFGLAVLPAIGYQSGRTNVQAVLLGTAAVIFTVGYRID